ncbi:helix-turn-helix domain-containing protein [Streptomyces sp. RPA4-5]|uniref:winged helix-turn-helix domain-containing protein n=1 Tax=Streptomyces TaxID=1883 RepID=UPI00143E56C4|nr:MULTISPECIES: transcriptional regulator [Streptomyces]MCX4639567.1 transcriptional regulator [Streptomyces platensis]QIY56937.1 helix-turn-helix domain-containing protein [Streptomyces sp. RPA4-5]WJY39899.1 transcriptional regulator [Streptomyces sp. P9-2B-2]
MAHADFDPVLLDPTRLTIMSLLAGAQWAEFGWVKESAGLSPSALSKQISTLESHGYVEVRKGYVGKRPRTWVHLSDGGRSALEAHAAALQRIVEESRRTAGGDGDQGAAP